MGERDTPPTTLSSSSSTRAPPPPPAPPSVVGAAAAATSLANRASFTHCSLRARAEYRAPRATARSSRAPSPPLPLVARWIRRRHATDSSGNTTSVDAARTSRHESAACSAAAADPRRAAGHRGRRGRRDAPPPGASTEENARAPAARRVPTARHAPGVSSPREMPFGARRWVRRRRPTSSPRARRDRVRATKSAPWEKARKALHRSPGTEKEPSETSIEPAF